MRIPVGFEPSLLEEAVFLFTRQQEREGSIDRPGSLDNLREVLYEKGEDEAGFRRFYQERFEGLGLGEMFRKILSQHPCLDRPDLSVCVRRVFSRKHEGSELYVDGPTKTAVIRLRADSFLEPDRLAVFLRREVLRISDMLDPCFEYSPEAQLGGAHDVSNDLIRERFSVLWDRYIDARLDGAPLSASARLKQIDLIQMAKDQILAKSAGGTGRVCGLCGFSDYDRIEDWDQPDGLEIIRSILQDHPDWRPEMKCCRQCFEMYQARGAPVRER
ncbi:MAG: hypothetical protein MOGMAGMI_02126 [Candidatus Omnitrophica bacterium]|nr:hypothetical protein [Candidatus Omnitrophota bacterium]